MPVSAVRCSKYDDGAVLRNKLRRGNRVAQMPVNRRIRIKPGDAQRCPMVNDKYRHACRRVAYEDIASYAYAILKA